jgi:hypothetical protein
MRGNESNAFDKEKGYVLCCHQRAGSVGVSASRMHEPQALAMTPFRCQCVCQFRTRYSCVCACNLCVRDSLNSPTTQFHFRGLMIRPHTICWFLQ